MKNLLIKGMPTRRRLLGLMVFLFLVAAIFILTHLPPGFASLKVPLEYVNGDKSAHFFAYLTLTIALLVGLGFGRGRGGFLIAFLGLSVLAGLDELTQPYFERCADWEDWLYDVMGIALGILLVGLDPGTTAIEAIPELKKRGTP